MNNKTSASIVLAEYIKTLTKKKTAIIRSVLVNYYIPGIGGEKPRGQRASDAEIKTSLAHLDTLNAEELEKAISIAEQVFEERGIEREKRRRHRHVITAFVDFAKESGYFSKEQLVTDNKKVSKHRNLRGEGERKPTRLGQSNQTPYALNALRTNSGELVYPEDYINSDLEKEISAYEQWRLSQGVSISTVTTELENLYRILGWLYRYKDIKLPDLRLTSLVPHTQLLIPTPLAVEEELEKALLSGTVFQSRQYDELNSQKALALEFAEMRAEKIADTVKQFLEFAGGCPDTKILYLRTWKNVAKYIFRDVLGQKKFKKPSAIPAWEVLNTISVELQELAKKTPPAVPHKNKSVPWGKAYDVLLFYQGLITDERPHHNSILKKQYDRNPCPSRADNVVANDLQRFLTLGMLMVIPPNRSRTYYELELGRTLLFGVKNGDEFTSTPFDNLSNTQTGKFYIHLNPADYKTGETYGEWWSELPDMVFPNGATFYSYIYSNSQSR